jgi:hypothetical protein
MRADPAPECRARTGLDSRPASNLPRSVTEAGTEDEHLSDSCAKDPTEGDAPYHSDSGV